MSIAIARRECLLADSYSRMEVVMCWSPLTRYEGPKLRASDWWRLLGEEWSTCDNLWEWSDVLRYLLQKSPRRHVELMMTLAERTALAQMPAEFTVWRGCHEINADGLSWTLDRSTAEKFPFLHRYRRMGEEPILLEGRCKRSRVVLKLDRQESEVIAYEVEVVGSTSLLDVTA